MNHRDTHEDDAAIEASKAGTGAASGETDERVGYGRPPRATRFRPGQSGNPRGRPKGSRNTGTIVKDVLARKVSLNGAGGRRQVAVREAIVLRMAEAAGDLKAAAAVLALDERHAPPSEATGPVTSDRDDEALIANFLARHAIIKEN
ncbi:DUF5681 domain-containing protein [Microvirga sp. 2YAF29]|uniref:DUF5681 domain-containing protein n=1 Tax=Microvirga sp. 2YAF29 TaxID=3233031 RepID=UPI003F98EC15